MGCKLLLSAAGVYRAYPWDHPSCLGRSSCQILLIVSLMFSEVPLASWQGSCGGGVDRSTQLDRSPTYQSSLLPGLATKWDSAVSPSLLGLGCFVVASGGKSSAAASGRLVNGCEGTGAASTPCTCCYAVIALLGCARWCWSPPR